MAQGVGGAAGGDEAVTGVLYQQQLHRNTGLPQNVVKASGLACRHQRVLGAVTQEKRGILRGDASRGAHQGGVTPQRSRRRSQGSPIPREVRVALHPCLRLRMARLRHPFFRTGSERGALVPGRLSPSPPAPPPSEASTSRQLIHYFAKARVTRLVSPTALATMRTWSTFRPETSKSR